jgi:hypothetical protein
VPGYPPGTPPFRSSARPAGRRPRPFSVTDRANPWAPARSCAVFDQQMAGKRLRTYTVSLGGMTMGSIHSFSDTVIDLAERLSNVADAAGGHATTKRRNGGATTARWVFLPAAGASLYALVRSDFFSRQAKEVVDEAKTLASDLPNDLLNSVRQTAQKPTRPKSTTTQRSTSQRSNSRSGSQRSRSQAAGSRRSASQRSGAQRRRQTSSGRTGTSRNSTSG